ncbi:MAG: nuclear transport factor 2 family protein [Desulfobacterales bacterium]|nr:MAG: nuclear transport factor 2 family protein [Desulfobacterales bacterium]
MKTKGRNFGLRAVICLLFCGLILFWSFQVFGEEWTEEQKEIWKVVVADYESFKQGDLEGLKAARHDDVVIWWGNKFMPFDKKEAMDNYQGWFSWDKPVNWELKPLAINVVGNIAVVFYAYKYSGKIISNVGLGRAMKTWIKQDNKWQLIGGFSASCAELPPCRDYFLK